MAWVIAAVGTALFVIAVAIWFNTRHFFAWRMDLEEGKRDFLDRHYGLAEQCLRAALQRAELLHEKDNRARFTTLDLLGRTLLAQKSYGEAEGLLQQAVVLCDQSLDRNKRRTWWNASRLSQYDLAWSLANLGFALDAQGKNEAAQAAFDRSLAILEVCVTNDSDVPELRIKYIATLFGEKRRYAEAERLFSRIAAATEKRLGSTHPRVAENLHQAVAVRLEQGKYAEAETLLRRVLSIQEAAFGVDREDTITTLADLGKLCFRQGRLEEAETIYQRALAALEARFGDKDLRLRETLIHLAGTYESRGKHADAEQVLKRAEALSTGAGMVAADLNNQGVHLMQLGQFAEAERLFQRSLSLSKASVRPSHPDLVDPLRNLATVRFMQGRYKDGEALARRVLSIQGRSKGSEHPELAGPLNTLAIHLHKQGEYSQAQSYYDQARRIAENSLGSEHPTLSAILTNLGMLYVKTGSVSAAEPLLREALRIKEKVLGPEHEWLAWTLDGLAEMHCARGEASEAERLYRLAIDVREKALGTGDLRLNESLAGLASLYRDQARYPDAEELYRRAIEIVEQSVGPDHPDLVTVLNGFALLHAALKNTEKRKRSTSERWTLPRRLFQPIIRMSLRFLRITLPCCGAAAARTRQRAGPPRQ
jgi:tetratricopeptide (TPR) repeat protein